VEIPVSNETAKNITAVVMLVRYQGSAVAQISLSPNRFGSIALIEEVNLDEKLPTFFLEVTFRQELFDQLKKIKPRRAFCFHSQNTAELVTTVMTIDYKNEKMATQIVDTFTMSIGNADFL